MIHAVKPALVTTCIQRPPLFKDHLVMSQLWLYSEACSCDHLTTSIQGPFGHVPIVALQCILPLFTFQVGCHWAIDK